MDANRVAQITYTVGTRTFVGSGLLVGDRYVLTARHCTEGTGLRVAVGGKQYSATIHVQAEDPMVDLAVLALPITASTSFLRFAQIDRSQSAVILDCQALGYPWWKRDASGTRVLAQLDGYIPTAEGTNASPSGTPSLLTLKSHGPEIARRPIEPGALYDVAGSEEQAHRVAPSAWGGMSGAGVTAGQYVVGVVRSHNLAEGGGSLTLTPITAIRQLTNVAQFRAALGMRNDDELTSLPDPYEAAYPRQLRVLDSSGRPPDFGDVSLGGATGLGVRRARADVDRRGNDYFPYVPRRSEDTLLTEAVARRLQGHDRRMLLVKGPTMSGKSRTLAEAVKSQLAHGPIRALVPRVDADLNRIADLAGSGRAVLWLDNLDLFFPSLSVDAWAAWARHPGLAVVATVQAGKLQDLAGIGQPRPAWDLVGDESCVEIVSLGSSWSPTDLAALKLLDDKIQDALKGGLGLPLYLGAGESLRSRMRVAADKDGAALVALAADWPRTGLPFPLQDKIARKLWIHYLEDAPADSKEATEYDAERYGKALDWASQPIPGTHIALIDTTEGLVADDLLTSDRSEAQPPLTIPLAVWKAARDSVLDRRNEMVWLPTTVAIRARSLGCASVAEELFAAATETMAAWVDWLEGNFAMQATPPDLELARPALRRAAVAGRPDAQTLLAGALLQGHPPDIQGARHWLRLAARSGFVQAQLALANLLIASGGDAASSEAQELFESAAASGDSLAQMQLGRFLIFRASEASEYQRAFEWCERAALSGKPETLQVLHIAALGIWSKAKDLESAARGMRLVMELGDPGLSAEAGMNLAAILIQDGDRLGAISACRKVIDLGDDSRAGPARILMSEALEDDGELDLAADALRAAIGHKASEQDAAMHLGQVLAKQQKLGEAREAYALAVREGSVDYPSTFASMRIGDLSMTMGDVATGEKAYQAALMSSDSFVAARSALCLADIFDSRGEAEEEMGAYSKAAATGHPELSVLGSTRLVLKLLRNDDLDAAEASLAKLMGHDISASEAWLKLGLLLTIQFGDLENATATFDVAARSTDSAVASIAHQARDWVRQLQMSPVTGEVECPPEVVQYVGELGS